MFDFFPLLFYFLPLFYFTPPSLVFTLLVFLLPILLHLVGFILTFFLPSPFPCPIRHCKHLVGGGCGSPQPVAVVMELRTLGRTPHFKVGMVASAGRKQATSHRTNLHSAPTCQPAWLPHRPRTLRALRE